MKRKHGPKTHLASTRFGWMAVATAGIGVLTSTLWAGPPLMPLTPPQFTLDRISPSIVGGTPTADDILEPGLPDPNVVVDGIDLDLGDPNDDIDGISPNITYPGAAKFVLLFSVDRATIGAALPDPSLVAAGMPYNVADQAARRQASGDMYMSTLLFDFTGASRSGTRGNGNNVLTINQFDEGGTSFRVDPNSSAEDYNADPQEQQDNVTGAGGDSGSALTEARTSAIYFTLTGDSPALSKDGFPGSANPSGAHIFYNANPGVTSTTLYAGRAQLGLSSPDDDVDALLVIDRTDPSVFQATDIVLFSLTPGSPSLAIINGASPVGGAADIFMRTPGQPIQVFASAADLGLGALPDLDNVDALGLLLCNDAFQCARDHGIRRRMGDCNNDGAIGLPDLVPCLNNCLSGPDVPLDGNGVAMHGVTNGVAGFVPEDLVIEIGDTVRWTWGLGTHNVVSGVPGYPDGNFCFPDPNCAPANFPGATFDQTFDHDFLAANPMPANVYPYYCEVHGETGAVFVRPHTCSWLDFDGDRDVDITDFAEFQRVFGTP